MNTQNTNHLRSESHSHDQEPPSIPRILREGIVRGGRRPGDPMVHGHGLCRGPGRRKGLAPGH